MKTSISHAALIVALSAGSAFAQTPPGVDTNPYILENLNGVAVSAFTPGALNNGAPTQETWATYAGSGYAQPTTTTAEYFTNSNQWGTGGILTQGSNVITNATGCKSSNPCTWVNPASNDPYKSYQWTPATYANVAAAAPGSIAPVTSNPNSSSVAVAGTYASGDYVVNSNGQLVNPSAATCGSSAGCKFVTSATYDLTASKNLPAADIFANNGFKGWASPTGDSTTSYLGGNAYTNSKTGNGTAVGPNGVLATAGANQAALNAGGLLVQDGNSNAAIVAPTGIGIVNPNGAAGIIVPANGVPTLGATNVNGTALVSGDGLVVQDAAGKNTTTVGSSSISVVGPNGSVVIADPSITVTGGGTQTQIVNGVTTASGVAGSTYGFQATGNGTYVGLGVKANQTGVQVSNANGSIQLGSTSGATPGVTIQDASNTTLINANGVLTSGGLNASGQIKGGSITDGTATLSGGNLTGVGTLSASNVNAGTVNSATIVNSGNTKTGSLTVTGAASVGNGLTVNGGVQADSVTVAGTTTTNTLKAVTVNAGTVNAGTANVSGPLTVGGQATFNGGMDAGNNVISNVADPSAKYDAANKNYVDTGLGNLSNIMTNKFQHADGGIAAAMSLQSPDRTGNQTWAVSLNEGFWNGQNATGFTGIAQLANLGTWEVAGKGGFAVTSKGDIGGVVGFQIAGGGGYVPLK